jgi:hypothetical protein
LPGAAFLGDGGLGTTLAAFIVEVGAGEFLLMR